MYIDHVMGAMLVCVQTFFYRYNASPKICRVAAPLPFRVGCGHEHETTRAFASLMHAEMGAMLCMLCCIKQ
jgi:hypothetical protein